MTLLELLVKELPKLGGWPEDISEFITQDGDGSVFCWAGVGLFMAGDSWCITTGDWRQIIFPKTPDPATDYAHAIINRQQYEAVLAASKTEWDGEGLPPVGCEVECHLNEGIIECVVVGYDFDGKAVVLRAIAERTYFACQYHADKIKPRRTEADKKRDSAIESLMRLVCGPSQVSATVNKLYDAIAAGKIPGVKLED